MVIKQSKHDAKLAFILSLFFLIPYLNIFFCTLSLFIGFKTLRKIKHDPKHFGGKRYAIAAISISSGTLILSLLAFIYLQVTGAPFEPI